VADALFVDEAGQMSLANVLAMAPAARSIVLLGDPARGVRPRIGQTCICRQLWTSSIGTVDKLERW
jgi:hypothetical protein